MAIDDVGQRLLHVLDLIRKIEIAIRAAEHYIEEARYDLSSVSGESPAIVASMREIDQSLKRLEVARQELIRSAFLLQFYMRDIGFSGMEMNDKLPERPTEVPWYRQAKAAHEIINQFRDQILVVNNVYAEHPREATRAYCKALGQLAIGLAFLANPVSGSISIILDCVANGLKAPMSSPAMEILLAAADKALRGADAPEIGVRLSAESIIRLAANCTFVPGLPQLKLAAFLLRLAGIVICCGEGLPLDGCHCLPNFVSDAGTTLVSLTAAATE